MKHIIWRAMYDFEKEERWLNEMSAKGLSLSDYSWCRYVFEEKPNTQYIYRIELLENLPKHPESSAYLRFLEENGIECAAMYWRWVYLRKNAADGPFEIYSDNASQLKYYQRLLVFFNMLMGIEFGAGLTNLAMPMIHLFEGGRNGFPMMNLIIGILATGFGIIFFKIGQPIRKRIKKLKNEQLVME
ncbi:MAG TPA: hypothetical protein DCS67_12120 [Clostridiales bacterium UBA8960]|nr:hypothetical protein [Clostridiales bacterium UBA8960]